MTALLAESVRAATVRLAGLDEQSIVDGPGLRMTVFAQGCPHACPGCHNPSTHAFDAGEVWDAGLLLERFDDNPMLRGVTLSGGEPLAQPAGLLPLARGVKERGGDVWCFSGYVFEELLPMAALDDDLAALLGCIDVLVDGRYVEARRSLSALYRGSVNQRIINMPRSLERGAVVPWEEERAEKRAAVGATFAVS